MLDRKTWLFVGHEVSARRAADALTILRTCKKMGINARTYLRDTLAKIRYPLHGARPVVGTAAAA